MSKRRKKNATPENHDRWLITYSDLITLLMIFFVVLYSMSKVDANKFRTLSISLSNAMFSASRVQGESGGGQGVLKDFADHPVKDPAQGKQQNQTMETVRAQDAEAIKKAQQEQQNLQQVQAQLQQYIEKHGLSQVVATDLTSDGVQITLRDVALFDTGSADLKSDALRILAGLSPFLNLSTVKDHQIKVEGHTDNRPISTPQYPSNWFLSSARATNVVSFLQSQSIDPQRLSAVGYGEYRPVIANDSPEHQAKNRRVNVIIMRKQY